MALRAGHAALVALLIAAATCIAIAGARPEQLQLSPSEDRDDEVIVFWMTSRRTDTSTVRYGTSSSRLYNTVTSEEEQERYPFRDYDSPYIHEVTVTRLRSNTQYYYQVGDPEDGWSDIFTFQTSNRHPDADVRVFTFGDQDMSGRSQTIIEAMAKRNAGFNYMIHVGDINYSDGRKPEVWDEYGEMMEPLLATLPSVFAIGNHEKEQRRERKDQTLIAYLARFRHGERGNQEDDAWWSVNMGAMHVVMISSEHHSESDPWRCRDCTERQTRFLEMDLREADKPENRRLRPWIIVVQHRPMYNAGRKGMWHLQKKAFEPIFERYRVNIVLEGHCHNYERTYPVYDGDVITRDKGSSRDPYIQEVMEPRNRRQKQGQIHLIVGTGGAKSNGPCPKTKLTLGKIHWPGWGYGMLEANRRRLKFKYVDTRGRTLDEFQICSQNRCREPPEVPGWDSLPPASQAKAPPSVTDDSSESPSEKAESSEEDSQQLPSPPPKSPNPPPRSPSPSPKPSSPLPTPPADVPPNQSPAPWKAPSSTDSPPLTPWQNSVLQDLEQKLENQDLTPWQRGQLQNQLNEKREIFQQKQTTSSNSQEGPALPLHLTPWQKQVLAELKKKINAQNTPPWQQTQLQKELEQKLNNWKPQQSFLMQGEQGEVRQVQLTPWQHSVLEELKGRINSPNVTKWQQQKLQREMEEKLSLWEENRQSSQGGAAGTAQNQVEAKDKLDSSNAAFSGISKMPAAQVSEQQNSPGAGGQQGSSSRDAAAPAKVPRAITQPHLESPQSHPKTLDELMDEDECAANELLAQLCIAADVDISQEIACQNVADGLVRTCHIDEIQDEQVQRFIQDAEDFLSDYEFDDDGLEYIAVIPSIGVFNDSDGYALDYNDPNEVLDMLNGIDREYEQEDVTSWWDTYWPYVVGGIAAGLILLQIAAAVILYVWCHRRRSVTLASTPSTPAHFLQHTAAYNVSGTSTPAGSAQKVQLIDSNDESRESSRVSATR